MKCRCGKICKNSQGLKIHPTRMKCLKRERAPQRTGTSPGETPEEPGQELPHRARNLQVPQPIPQNRPLERVRVKWPQACKMAVWQQFDENASSVLDTTAKGDVDRRLRSMTTIIISLAVERFGAVEKRAERTPLTMNQRAANNPPDPAGAQVPQDTVQKGKRGATPSLDGAGNYPEEEAADSPQS